MIRFLLKRFAWMAITLWIVYTVSFFLMRAVPGGPFAEERKASPEIERNFKARYNMDAPRHVQYFTHLGAALRGDLGPCMRLEDYTVNEVIAQGFPVSASLGIFAMTFAMTLGVTAGVVSAIRRSSALDLSLMGMATMGIAVPNFVLASLSIVAFVFSIQIFPAAGWGTLEQIILPAICLGAPFAGYIARLTRTGMMEVLSLDYIRTAYAKGLSDRRVVVRHALRGALLPVVSYLGPATAGILTGSLVLERIFFLPGLGSHFVEGALQRDFPLALGMVMVYTFILFLMNTLVDVSYRFIDPRVKFE